MYKYKHKNTLKKQKNKKHKQTRTKYRRRHRHYRSKFYKGGESYKIQPLYTPYNDGGNANNVNVNLNKTIIQGEANAKTDPMI